MLTVGRALPHTEVKIVDEFGEVLPINQPGEVCSRGYCIMQCYWNDRKTAATIDSAGWLHSGDIGQMDEQGYVQIVGRIKDMIIRGGENIYPREIEEKLYTHKDVQDAAVLAFKAINTGRKCVLGLKSALARRLPRKIFAISSPRSLPISRCHVTSSLWISIQ